MVISQNTNRVHDIKEIDQECSNQLIYEDVLKFHAKTTWVSHQQLKNVTRFFDIDSEKLKNIENCETKFFPYDFKTYPLELSESKYQRNPSAKEFLNKKILFDDFKKIIHASFGYNPEKNIRPTPSAGALYPVEVLFIVLKENIYGSNFFHYIPKTNSLETIGLVDKNHIKKIIYFDEQLTENAQYIIVYCINMRRSLVKYRYRGYRHALMEVGSMYHQFDLVCSQHEIHTRLCSGFSDYSLAKIIKIDFQQFAPVILQFVGKG